jgi:hypothetical protein
MCRMVSNDLYDKYGWWFRLVGLVVLTVLVRAEVAAARLQPSAAMVYSVHIHFGHSLGMDSG